MTSTERALRVMQRADVLGRISEEEGMLTRRFATAALGEAAEAIEGWMREAGLDVWRDAVGNVIGRTRPEGVPLVLGSHFDTVRDAGRYDGALGVLCAIEVAEALGTEGPPLEVVAFADEEGARYGVAYLGSAAYRGRFDPAWLELEDADGIPMANAIEAAGGDVAALRDPTLQQPVTSEPAGAAASALAGYVEVHIEQGPVLESEGLPVGVVTAIVGQTRELGMFTGRAGHAGTVPATLRADALAGAAEFVLAVEESMLRSDGLMATVGSLTVEPGVGNVIPGRVELSVDLRHADDAARMAAFDSLGVTLREIADRRRLQLEATVIQQTNAVPMDASLSASLEEAIEAQGLTVRRLVSGAGHDAAIVGREAPAAMLFVRCAAGVSHSPAESVDAVDVEIALAVLLRACRSVGS